MKTKHYTLGVPWLLFAALFSVTATATPPTIEMNESGDAIRISTDVGLRFTASYTKEGYWGKSDHGGEGSTGVTISISGVKDKHDHISIFAIDVNGDVASEIFSLKDGAYPGPSQLTVSEDSDAIRIHSPAGLRYSATFTKDGYWGISEYPQDNSNYGVNVGLQGVTSSHISVAAIDAEGNVVARKIPLGGAKAEDVYDYNNARIVLNLDQKLENGIPDYVTYTKTLPLENRGEITTTVEVSLNENYYTVELVTWGSEGLTGEGGLGYRMGIFPYSDDWNFHKDTQAIYANGSSFEEALKDLEVKFNGVDGQISITGTGDATIGEGVITITKK